MGQHTCIDRDGVVQAGAAGTQVGSGCSKTLVVALVAPRASAWVGTPDRRLVATLGEERTAPADRWPM